MESQENPAMTAHEPMRRLPLDLAHRTHRTVVTLCGSTRFFEDFRDANFRETMAGRIVLTVGFYPHAQDQAHGEHVAVTPAEKADLDRLHFDKIHCSDEILVLNVDGYVGESTRNEIALAVLLNREIRWLDEARGGDRWLEDNGHDIAARVAAHMKAGR
jgi:hypothetical protein